MKKQLFYALGAGLMLLSACSSEEPNVPVVPGEGFENGEIALAINPNGDQTRLARVLGSTEAKSNVDEVKVVLYKKGKDNKYAVVDLSNVVTNGTATGLTLNWTKNGSAATNPEKTHSAGSNTETLHLKNLDKAANDYILVAYGYNKTTPVTNIAAPTGDITDLTNAKYTATTTTAVEEVFAGRIAFSTDADGKIGTTPRLTMHRMVAGVLGYFKNIPLAVNGKAVAKVVVKAPRKNTAYYLDDSYQNQVSDATATEYDVLTITPTDSEQTDTDDIFTREKGTYDGVWCQADAFCTGAFVVPFDAVANTTTFRICLVDENGEVLKSWKAKLGEDFSIPVNRNNIYAMGIKKSTDTPDNPDDPNPDPDDPGDDPIDLSVSNDVAIELCNAWSAINQMGLEEE